MSELKQNENLQNLPSLNTSSTLTIIPNSGAYNISPITNISTTTKNKKIKNKNRKNKTKAPLSTLAETLEASLNGIGEDPSSSL